MKHTCEKCGAGYACPLNEENCTLAGGLPSSPPTQSLCRACHEASKPKPRDCYNCVNYELCFFRHAIGRTLYQSKGLLVEDEREKEKAALYFVPGTQRDVYRAVAGACLKYEEEGQTCGHSKDQCYVCANSAGEQSK